jgi:hypothetical protein
VVQDKDVSLTISKHVADMTRRHERAKEDPAIFTSCREFLTSLVAYCLSEHAGPLQVAAMECGFGEAADEPLRNAVEHTLEQIVWGSDSSLHAVLWSRASMANVQREAALGAKRKLLHQKPQSFFGIPKELISPSLWAEPAGHLASIATIDTPGGLLDGLAGVSATIYRTIAKEAPRANDSQCTSRLVHCIAIRCMWQIFR